MSPATRAPVDPGPSAERWRTEAPLASPRLAGPGPAAPGFGARAAAAAAAGMGIVVALAPLLPGPLRPGLLVAALAGWVGVTVVALGALLHRIWSERTREARLIAAIAGVAFTVGAVAASQLELVRWLEQRPALTWNVDWRFHLSHAQAIARTGGLDSALAYAGAPIRYHVGPAWLAGAVGNLTGGGVPLTLFGIIPAATLLAAGLGAVALLLALGVRERAALLAGAVSVVLPGIGFGAHQVLQALRGGLLDGNLWLFAAGGLMLNSSLALAVGVSSLALLLRPKRSAVGFLAGVAGLASLVAIKPEFFAGFGAFLGVVALERLVRRTDRDSGPLLGAAAALGLAVVVLGLLPGAPAFFAAPQWSPGNTGLGFRGTWELPVALALLALVLSRGKRTVPRDARRAAAAAVLTTVLGAALLATVRIPAAPGAVEQLHRLGFLGYTATSEQPNWAQVFEPPVVWVAAALALGLLASLRRRGWRRATLVAGAALAASPVAAVAARFAARERGHEVAEDRGLLAVLDRIPTGGALLIASDLADPADDYARPLRGALLTAYGGHRFYAANVRYWNFLQPDAPARLDTLRRFFGSPWSGWQERWLTDERVTAVLVHDRCPARWAGSPGLPLRVVAAGGGWTALAPAFSSVPARPVSVPAARPDLVPAYGRAGCLSGAGSGGW